MIDKEGQCLLDRCCHNHEGRCIEDFKDCTAKTNSDLVTEDEYEIIKAGEK